MIRLKSIDILGFKEPKRKVSIKFSDEPVTVIYGENGSGKTTLLKILHAIFNKDESYLIQENVKEIQLIYIISSSKTKSINIKVNNKNVTWGENIKDLSNRTSILFGVNRGVISDTTSFDPYLPEISHLLRRMRNEISHSPYSRGGWEELNYLLHKNSRIAAAKAFSEEDLYNKKHISVDLISIADIESAIIRQSRAGQRESSDKVKNAFFNTISSAVDIEMEEKNYELPDDFDERVDKKREILLSLVKKLDNSSLQLKVLNFLEGKKRTSEIGESKIFRAMLVNILEKVEEENLELKSISQLIEIFNSHLYRNKKLIVTEEEAYIQFAKGKNHKLEKLSSGERHLLTFLTLFLIIGRNRDFFIIDEPEISLNMKWQRELLPLLSSLSPNSQIIVATHSPSISNRNTNYLVELI